MLITLIGISPLRCPFPSCLKGKFESLSHSNSPSDFLKALKVLAERDHQVFFLRVALQDMDASQLGADKIKNILVGLNWISDDRQGGRTVSNAIAILSNGLGTFEERLRLLSDAIAQCKESLSRDGLGYLATSTRNTRNAAVPERPDAP